MDNLSFFSENFSINKTNTYTLSLELDTKSYSYTIIDTMRNAYVAIKHIVFPKELLNKFFTDKLKFMFKEDAFLNKHYKSVNFNFVTTKTTLVPAALFNKKNLKDYFSFNHILNDYEELHFNYLKRTNAYNIFALPSEITTLLVNHFPEIRFFSQTTTFVENTLEKSENLKFKLPYIQANVSDSFFDISVIMSGKLILTNSFSYSEKNDIVYFILSVLKELNIKPHGAYLFMSGFMEQDSNFMEYLKKFIPHTKFSKLSGNTNYMFNDIGEHRFYNILNLHKCE